MGGKDGENVINLNDLSQFIPYQHFKTEGMFCLRELFQKGDCLQTEHEGCIFLSTSPSIFEEVSTFSVGKKRVPMPMLWAGSIPKNFHQIVECSNVNAETNKHSNNNLPRRYAFNGSNCGGNFNVQRHISLLFATLGFILNLEMSILSSAQENRISWPKRKFFRRDSFTQEKMLEVQTHCRDLLTKGKLLGLLTSTIQTALLARPVVIYNNRDSDIEVYLIIR